MIHKTGIVVVSGHTFDTPALVLTGISSGLSILGAIGIFLSYRKLPEKTFIWGLILHLTCADIGTALGYFLSVVRYGWFASKDGEPSNEILNGTTVVGTLVDSLCVIQSFCTTTSNIASFLWTLISVAYLNLKVNGNGEFIKRNIWPIRFSFWLVPVSVAAVCAGYDVLGDNEELTGPWCWINTQSSEFGWMMLGGKAWELGSYFFCPLFFIWYKGCFGFFKMFRLKRADATQTDESNKLNKFAWILFTLYVVRVWGTIRVLLYGTKATSHETVQDFSDGLLYVQAILDPSQAFWNFLFLCLLDGNVRQRLIRRRRSSYLDLDEQELNRSTSRVARHA